jgi:hypothetical protein
MATRNTQPLAEATMIFRTVDKGRNVIRTEGTFTIAIQELNFEDGATLNKPLPEKVPVKPVIVFEGTYKDGQGYYDGAILRGYIVFVYPSGYFGASAGLGGLFAEIPLAPASEQADEIRQQQLDYINNKIGNRAIEQPKDGINEVV